MALVATYGNTSAFNIKIYDMPGGGYYAVLNDVAAALFQRRNSAVGTDTAVTVNGSLQWLLDHFSSYSYDSVNKILTLSGAVDTIAGIVVTRTETYKFISDYVVEDTISFVANTVGASISSTNWNYYPSVDKVWDVDNMNFGDGSSAKGLGMGVQLIAGGVVYGCVADNGYNNQNCNKKRALASQSAIAATWITPNDAGVIALNAGNNYTLSIKQWFFKSVNTLYDFSLQATLAVALAKGFTGTTWEKIAKVTAYLNIYLANNLTDVMLIPSPFYNNGMWMRDSFWQSLQVDSSIEQAAISLFERKQLISGQMPTTVYNDLGVIAYQDESTCLYIIRAYYDKAVRGLSVSSTALINALSYINTIVVNDQYQSTTADGGAFKNPWDTFKNTTGSYSAYGQGIYALSLKCAQKLGFSVTNTQINNAITQYQTLYDTTNKYIKSVSDKTFIGTEALTPEALSLWLFNEKMLSDTIVNNHIANLRRVGMTVTGLKNLCNADGTYMDTSNFINVYSSGDYQNGGSWFLYEYLAYYAGFYHNCMDAKAFLNDRITREIGKDPLSHEYLQSAVGLSNYLSESGDRHVYSWNAASTVIKPSARQPIL